MTPARLRRARKGLNVQAWLLLVLLVGGLGLGAQAAILRVPESHATIQAAIEATSSGDTVLVAPGTYPERLVTPNRNITLVSNYFFSHDSLDIENTIIDGEWLGTVLQINTWLSQTFRVEGFTLKRGRGFLDGLNSHGGALDFVHWTNAIVRHMVFRENSTSGWDGVLMSGGGWSGFHGRLVLEDLRFHLYTGQIIHPEDVHQIALGDFTSVNMHKIRFVGCDQQTNIGYIDSDTIRVSDFVLDMTDYPNGSARTVCALRGQHRVVADSITIRGCKSDGQIFSVGADSDDAGSVSISNLIMEDCVNDRPFSLGANSSGEIFSCDSDTLIITNWISRGNFSLTKDVVGKIFGREAKITNLLAEDNVAGAPPDGSANCNSNCTGKILKLRNCSLENVVLRRNTSNLFDSITPEFATTGGSYGIGMSCYPYSQNDTLILRNVKIYDNVVNDPDDYSNPNTERFANSGRAMGIGVEGFPNLAQVVVLDSCVFVNNRQPNSAPESPTGDPLTNDRMVGSTVALSAPFSPKFVLRNCVFMHNDDGGLTIDAARDVTIENLIMFDNARMGMYCQADTSINIHNMLIQGTYSYEANLTYPYNEWVPSYQCALAIIGGVTGSINNLSLIDNHTEFLFWTNHIDRPRFHVSNTIMWGNTYDYFTNPWWSITEFPPPLFDHCLIQEFQPGEGNLIGVDPLFDPSLGLPFLSAQSPCIDAGNADPAQNDFEDPANPGFALWPSQGTLRNDIGYTGGPHAALLDTNWVAVPAWRPQVRPTDFTLAQPYPNPFNPATRIPYTLLRPMPVRLFVYNLLGQEVAVLVEGMQAAGQHLVAFNAGRLASGLYLVTLEAGGRAETRTVTLLR